MPRLAAALLRRFLGDNEPLAGDLVEQFARGRSQFWLYRQMLGAIVIRAFQPRDLEHPLGLADPAPFADPAGFAGAAAFRTRSEYGYGRPARSIDQPRHINLTASPLPDVGGLGLVALGALVALVNPAALWMFVPSVAGGAVFGLTMALLRRRTVLDGPAGASRMLRTDRDVT